MEDFAEIPFRVADWQSNEARSEVSFDKRLASSAILDRTYVNSRGDKVYLTIVYTANMSDLHQPEICLGGSGWSTKTRQPIVVRPTRGSAFPAILNWMSSESSGTERIVLYWFNSPRAKTTVLGSYKIKMYLHRILNRRIEGVALVRVLVPSSGDQYRSEEAAKSFAQAIASHIDVMMSKPPVIQR